MDREYLETLLRDLGQMLTSGTVIGDPLTFGKVTIIPVVSVSFGFGSGGGGSKPTDSEKQVNASGSTAGAKLTPIAFLSVHEDGTVNLHQIQTKGVGGPVDRLLEMAPGFIDKLSATIGKGKGQTDAAADVTTSSVSEVEIVGKADDKMDETTLIAASLAKEITAASSENVAKTTEDCPKVKDSKTTDVES